MAEQAERRDYYRAADLAALWHVSRDTVEQLCRKRQLGHLRIGRSVLIPQSAVTEFERVNLVPATRSRRLYRVEAS